MKTKEDSKDNWRGSAAVVGPVLVKSSRQGAVPPALKSTVLPTGAAGSGRLLARALASRMQKRRIGTALGKQRAEHWGVMAGRPRQEDKSQEGCRVANVESEEGAGRRGPWLAPPSSLPEAFFPTWCYGCCVELTVVTELVGTAPWTELELPLPASSLGAILTVTKLMCHPLRTVYWFIPLRLGVRE